MKKPLLLLAVTVLVQTAAVAQLRITKFTPGGGLTWTNAAHAGAYHIEWAGVPSGPWHSFEAFTNLNLVLAETNRVTVQTPHSDAPVFYRVAWLLPDPLGIWDCRGFDTNDNLVFTGRLGVASVTTLSTNPPILRVSGWKDIGYAGAATNQSGELGIYLGAGELEGTLDIRSAQWSLLWPPGCRDCGMVPGGTLWPNNYTGYWATETIFGTRGGGRFQAERR